MRTPRGRLGTGAFSAPPGGGSSSVAPSPARSRARSTVGALIAARTVAAPYLFFTVILTIASDASFLFYSRPGSGRART